MSDLEERLQRIESFAELEQGWLDGDGEPISKGTIEFAKYMLAILYKAGDTDFCIFPNPDGIIVFEWEDAEIEIWKE